MILKFIYEIFQLVRDMICAPNSVFSKINEDKLAAEAASVFMLSLAITCFKGYLRSASEARRSLTFFENDGLNQALQSVGHPGAALLIMNLIYVGFIFVALAVSKVTVRKIEAKRFVVGLFAISALAVCSHFIFGVLSFLPVKAVFNWVTMLVYVWVSVLTIVAMQKCLGLSFRASLATFLVAFVTLFPFSLHFGLAPYLSWISNP